MQQELTGRRPVYTLDETDRRILRLYQRDASVSYRELGEVLNISPTTVFDRIKQMKKVGVIKSFVPILDLEQLGLGTTAWIQAKTAAGQDCCLVAEEIAKNTDVMEVHEVTGDYDLLIKVKARSNLHYHNISDIISKIEGVQDIVSTVSLRTVKEDIRANI